jgi:DNA-binding NtrC family response regulator
MAALLRYDWPGNVRELENTIERALVLGTRETLVPEDLPDSVLETSSVLGAAEGKYQVKVRELKKKLIMGAVEQSRGSYIEAARILGMHPNYLHRLIRNLALKEQINAILAAGWKGHSTDKSPSALP